MSSLAVTVRTGCWFSRHNSFGLATTRIDASWSSGTKPIPRPPPSPLSSEGSGGGRCHREADRQPAKVFAVISYTVGIADADLGHPVLFGDRAGYLPVEGGIELALDVELGQPNARRSGRCRGGPRYQDCRAGRACSHRRRPRPSRQSRQPWLQVREGSLVPARRPSPRWAFHAREVVDLIEHEGNEFRFELGDLSFSSSRSASKISFIGRRWPGASG